MILAGASPFGLYAFGGPGLIPRQSAQMPVTCVFVEPPVPGPPLMPVTCVFTQRGNCQQMSVTSIMQGGHKLIVELINADIKESGNAVYDSEQTL